MNEICGNPDCGAECKQKPLVCSQCKATPYCSSSCQKSHWKVHKKMCKSLNKGKEQQFHHRDHSLNKRVILRKIKWLQCWHHFRKVLILDALRDTLKTHSCQQVYSYFKRTKEDDAPQKANIIAELMKKIATDMPANDKLVFLHVMCCLLLHAKPWQVDLPTSPVKILLQVGVDVNAIPEEGVYNCLTLLAAQNSERESFKKNQVTIARQLIEGGAQVNLPSLEEGAGLIAPLYFACASCHYTNLDFIQLLIENGANPNQQTVDGMTPLMSSIEMAVGAAIFILKFEHENKVAVDPNVRSKWGETVWSMLDKAIFRNMGQRETVRETGKAAVYSDKRWDNTEQYDVHIARLEEMKSLVEACGADMTDAPTSKEQLCDILSWQGHMFNIKEYVLSKHPSSGVVATKTTTRNESLQCDVCDLFNIDILRDKKAPSWSKDVNGKSCFYVEDKRTKIFEDHEGAEYLHSAGGGSQPLGWGS